METIIKEKKITKKNKREFVTYLIQIKKKVDLRQMLSSYIQHGNTNVYIHSRNVAYLSFKYAKHLENRYNAKINYEDLVVGAMLHDFFLYDWHDSEKCPKLHGFKHPAIASKNAQEYFNINKEQRLIIESHMWPLTLRKFPKSKEAMIVCMADKICSAKETINKKQ